MDSETKQIPYGIADYAVIRDENYYYVAKTPYLPAIEKAGKFLFFIRPRRFGKTLFLAVMEGYYDITYNIHLGDIQQNIKSAGKSRRELVAGYGCIFLTGTFFIAFGNNPTYPLYFLPLSKNTNSKEPSLFSNDKK